MKGKNLKQFLNNQKAKRVGCILLAAAVLGTGAWAVDNGQKSDVPELTSFVDLDDQISIDEDEVPLTSAPKTSVKTQTSTTKKVVNLKKKSTKTYTQKSKPKSVKSPTITKTSRAATTTTNRVTTTYVTKRYKKNSKKMTMITTKKIKTTITTVTKTAANSGGTTTASVQKAATTTASAKKNTTPYNVPVATLAPLLDSRVMKAYQELHFDITIDGTVSYAGYFDARKQNITLREESDTIYHEIGHFVAFLAGNVDTKANFQSIYQQEKNSFTGSRRIYAIQNASEYFAECFREYTLNPATLKSTCPQTFEAITNALDKITDNQVAQAKAFYGSIWTK